MRENDKTIKLKRTHLAPQNNLTREEILRVHKCARYGVVFAHVSHGQPILAGGPDWLHCRQRVLTEHKPKPISVALAWVPSPSATSVTTPLSSASPKDNAIHFGVVTPMLGHVGRRAH